MAADASIAADQSQTNGVKEEKQVSSHPRRKVEPQGYETSLVPFPSSHLSGMAIDLSGILFLK